MLDYRVCSWAEYIFSHEEAENVASQLGKSDIRLLYDVGADRYMFAEQY